MKKLIPLLVLMAIAVLATQACKHQGTRTFDQRNTKETRVRLLLHSLQERRGYAYVISQTRPHAEGTVLDMNFAFDVLAIKKDTADIRAQLALLGADSNQVENVNHIIKVTWPKETMLRITDDVSLTLSILK